MEDKMNKPILASKTVWGFGIAGLLGLGQLWGVPGAEHIAADTVQILAGLLGLYGLRDAI